MSDTEASTRDRLLDAAMRLFLAKGADQVSVRAVNAEAGLNAGAVHYHFGSREGLITALLERELRAMWPVAADRLAAGPDGTVDIEALVTAVVEPFAEMVTTRDGRMLCHLLARAALPTGQLPDVSAQFRPGQFEVAVGRSLPRLTVREVTERTQLMFMLIMEVYGRPLSTSPEAASPFPETATMVAFLTAGLTAPTTSGR